MLADAEMRSHAKAEMALPLAENVERIRDRPNARDRDCQRQGKYRRANRPECATPSNSVSSINKSRKHRAGDVPAHSLLDRIFKQRAIVPARLPEMIMAEQCMDDDAELAPSRAAAREQKVPRKSHDFFIIELAHAFRAFRNRRRSDRTPHHRPPRAGAPPQHRATFAALIAADSLLLLGGAAMDHGLQEMGPECQRIFGLEANTAADDVQGQPRAQFNVEIGPVKRCDMRSAACRPSRRSNWCATN